MFAECPTFFYTGYQHIMSHYYRFETESFGNEEVGVPKLNVTDFLIVFGLTADCS